MTLVLALIEMENNPEDVVLIACSRVALLVADRSERIAVLQIPSWVRTGYQHRLCEQMRLSIFHAESTCRLNEAAMILQDWCRGHLARSFVERVKYMATLHMTATVGQLVLDPVILKIIYEFCGSVEARVAQRYFPYWTWMVPGVEPGELPIGVWCLDRREMRELAGELDPREEFVI